MGVWIHPQVLHKNRFLNNLFFGPETQKFAVTTNWLQLICFYCLEILCLQMNAFYCIETQNL